MAPFQKEMELWFKATGETLLQQPPSSADELLLLLDRMEILLSKIGQYPSISMYRALSPVMRALVSEKLMKHSDADVKVSVASCISEMTRITAPEAPYEDDDTMKEVLQLMVSSFKDIADTSSRSHAKRARILEIMCKIRSGVIMLDLECEEMIIDMFQHFLTAIREDHSENIFNYMAEIMSLFLEESEDISLNMLKPILSALENNNETVSPIAKKLAERVIQDCADKLKPYFQTFQAFGQSLEDYSEVVASVCRGDIGTCAQNNDSILRAPLVIEESTEETDPQDKDLPLQRSPKSPEEAKVDEVAMTKESQSTSENDSPGSCDALDSQKQSEQVPANEEHAGEEIQTVRDEVTPEVPVSLDDAAKDASIEPSPAEDHENEDVNVTSPNKTGSPPEQSQVVEESTEETDPQDKDLALQRSPKSPEEAKVDEVAMTKESQSTSENDSPGSCDAIDSQKQSEQVPANQEHAGEEIQTVRDEVTPEAPVSLDDAAKDASIEPSPAEDHENEDVNVTSPNKTGSLPEQSQVVKESTGETNTQDKEDLAALRRRSFWSTEEAAALRKWAPVSGGDSGSDSETDSLDQTENLKAASLVKKMSGLKKQKRSRRKQPARKVKNKSVIGKDQPNINDSETNSVDEKVLSDKENVSGAKHQRSGKMQSAKKAKRNSPLIGKDASDSETNSLEQMEVSDEETVSGAKELQRSRRKQPARKTKNNSGLIGRGESKDEDEDASDSDTNSLDDDMDVSHEDTSSGAKKKVKDSSLVESEETNFPVKRGKLRKAIRKRDNGEAMVNSPRYPLRSRKRTPGTKKAMVTSLRYSLRSRKDQRNHEEVPEMSNKRKRTPGTKKAMVTSLRYPLRSRKDQRNQVPETSNKRKRTPGTEKESGTVEYGENLVGREVKVWWPRDQKFYVGAVDSFDSVKKKHKVLYLDGDEEILNMKTEKWEFVGDSVVPEEEEEA